MSSDTGDIDYVSILEQIQRENEALREQVSKLKLAGIPWQSIMNSIENVIYSPLFWVGYLAGVVAMFIIGLAKGLLFSESIK